MALHRAIIASIGITAVAAQVREMSSNITGLLMPTGGMTAMLEPTAWAGARRRLSAAGSLGSI